MKIVKMSLVAAMLMGVSAYAVENVKIAGHGQVFYATADAGDGDLLDKDASAADTALHLNVSADLTPGISAGAAFTAVSTLGLENNFVSNVWGGSHVATAGTAQDFGAALGGVKVENASWFDEAWVAGTLGKTTVKLGRMQLDTPLAFTETWSVEYNTFEAAVAINQDLPDTTVVLAYVGNGNGTETFGQTLHSNTMALGHTVGAVVNGDGKMAAYGTDGAYAAGVINNSLEMLTVQGWYYDVTNLAQAYWLQADLSMEGIMAGVQYSGLTLDTKTGAEDTDSNVLAVMVGYEMKDVVTVKGAYSMVAEDFAAGFNTATASGASKVYTEAWWNYGYVTAADTTAFNITAEGTVAGINVAGYYTSADQSEDAGNNDMTELTITAGADLGPVNATLAYISTDAENQNDGDAYNTVQAYLTYNF